MRSDCPTPCAELIHDPNIPEVSALFNGNALAIWMYDVHSCQLLDANDSALAQYGYAREDFLQLTLSDIVATVQEHSKCLSHRHTYPNLNVQKHLRSDGTLIEVAIRSNDVAYGGRTCKLVIAEDLTERRTLDAELLQLVNHDALTGLPNRTLLAERMAQALSSAQSLRHKTAVISVDLDDFKKINDWYGHAIGDAYLKHVSQLLTRRLRGMDTVARMGGDEFAILLGEVDTVKSAGCVGKALLKALNKPAVIGGFTFQPSASLGIAIFPEHGSDMDEVWRCADAAMYRAKRAGGNRYIIAGPDPCTPTNDHAAIDNHLQYITRENRLQLHYQPQYSSHHRLRGIEALLRLPDSSFGYTSPDRLVTRAEDNGMIHPLGRCVLEEVCRQLKEWKALTGSSVRVAINVSPCQLLRKEFVSDVAVCLSRWNIDPSCIEMEIAERAIVDFCDLSVQMKQLHTMGINFVVDEFGTGYSSLQHLHRLPIAAVKISRTLVQRLCDSSGSYSIVNAMIALAHSLKIEVIAAGVEREEQRTVLERLGCDSMQGYLFAKPAHAREITKIVGKVAADSKPPRKIDPYSVRRPVSNRSVSSMSV